MPDVTLPGTGTKIETVDGAGGAQRQVVLLGALPPGASTEATAAALLLAANAIKAAAETLAGRTINTSAVSGTVALDGATLAALENITATLAGPVTVSNFPANTGLTDAQLRASSVPVALPSLARATDTPFNNGDTGLLLLAKRRDSDTTSVSADGDYTTLNMDESGRLKVSTQPGSTAAVNGSITANGQTISINVERASNITISMVASALVGHNATFEYSNNSTNGTDGTWYGVQVVRSNANTVEAATGVLAATPVYGWEASVNAYKWFRVRATAHTSGTAAYILQPGSYATEPIPAIQVTGTQPVSGTVTATVTGATVLPVTPTTLFTNSLATTNATLVKNTAGTLWSVAVSNTNAASRFLKLFNLTVAPTVGTSVPVFTVAIPPGGTVLLHGGSNGIRFGTGISLAITGAAADLDTTAIGAGDVKVATTYT